MHALRLALPLGVFLLPAVALAHPDIDEGRRLAQSAELERAMQAFDRAEASGRLSRDERVALHEGRALVYHALGDEARLSATLEALSALAPSHEMARDIPPALRERFEAMRPRAAPEPVTSTAGVEPRALDEPAEDERSGTAGVMQPAPMVPSPVEAARDAPVDTAPAPDAPLDDGDESSGLGPWPFIGAAVLVLALGAAAAIYFLVPGSSTQPSYPRHPL